MAIKSGNILLVVFKTEDVLDHIIYICLCFQTRWTSCNIINIINIINKNKLLAILEEFLMFCILGLKKTFYDGISVFINKTPKIYRERNHFDLLSQYWFHKPWPNYGKSWLEGWLNHFVWVSLICSELGKVFCFP